MTSDLKEISYGIEDQKLLGLLYKRVAKKSPIEMYHLSWPVEELEFTRFTKLDTGEWT